MKATILAVDDTPANLHLLAKMLSNQGYKLRIIPDGEQALSSAQAYPPDLILLDILMPHMDGYEVCSQLKADERTKNIPVIFISALNEGFDKVKAFEVGGLDYITKPFIAEEVIARVENQLRLKPKKSNC
jgi:PleD family two-component response regulator